MAYPKLPHWLTDTRLGREEYWLYSIGSVIAFFVFGIFSTEAMGQGFGATLMIYLLAIVVVVLILLLMAFRLNDIPAKTRLGFEQKGLAWASMGWLLAFYPSGRGEKSSFYDVLKFYWPENDKLNKKLYLTTTLKNIGIDGALLVIIIIIAFLLRFR